MHIFFPKGATLKKIMALSVVYVLSLFMLFAIFSKVLINENVILTLNVVTITVSVLAFFYLCKELFDVTSSLYKFRINQGRRPISFLLICFFSIPLLLYMSISIGMPSALHILMSEPAELVVTIKYKPSSYISIRSRRHGAVFVKEYTYFLNNQVYGISRADWDSLVSGDKLRLLGKQSYFGFSYDQYEKLRGKE